MKSMPPYSATERKHWAENLIERKKDGAENQISDTIFFIAESL